MPSGGPRVPNNPAMVSGPGALSARTDGGPSQPMMDLPDPAYGEQSEFQEIQGGAPMAMEPSAPPPPGLRDPSMRPNEPLTEGVPVGPGANSLQGVQDVMQEDMQAMVKYLPAMRHMAQQEGTPRSFQLFVKYLESYSG
jgi:hypothetical protein